MQKLISITITAGAAALSVFALFASPAHADLVTQYLTYGTPTIFPRTNAIPYASVTIDLTNPTTVNISFQALGNYTIESADVNLNVSGDPGFTVTIPTVSNSYNGFTPVLCCAAIGNPGDTVADLGNFTIIFEDFYGPTFVDSATNISFSVTNTSGTWSSAADVLQSNDQDEDAAALTYVCNTDPCTLAGGASNTGYATDGPVPVPVPAPLIGRGLPVLLAVSGVFVGIWSPNMLYNLKQRIRIR